MNGSKRRVWRYFIPCLALNKLYSRRSQVESLYASSLFLYSEYQR